jgi:predicted nucleotidyltransferase
MVQTLTRQRKDSVTVKSKTAVLRVPKKPKTSKSSKSKLADLRLKVTPILKPYASRISVFGSFARGEAAPSSDIDLLIALRPAGARPVLGLFEFIKLEQTLEKKLGCEVDLVTEDGLNPRRKKSIEKDRVILYEAG